MVKFLMITALGLSVLIGGLALHKKYQNVTTPQTNTLTATPVEVPLEPIEVRAVQPLAASKKTEEKIEPVIVQQQPSANETKIELPEANRIEELFKRGQSKLKFIETVTYKSHVNWLKGRPAWLSDYASFFETSRHFIARSLNGKSDYFKQEVAEGDRFNVLNKNIKLRFHLLVDASLCKMWLYAIDDTNKEKTLLKTYNVCLGRPDSSKVSGLLTPLGEYSLGNRIAIYKPKVMGYHNNKKVEMVRIFGSRWIPFDKEVSQSTAPAKGFGIHGVPWTEQGKELKQDKSSLGKYESDGCIRLSTEDMEELFAIIITKPTNIEIVKHFQDSKLFK